MSEPSGTHEELVFVESSLTDLEAERDAGDLSEPDYRLLRARYERRRAEILSSTAPQPPPVEGEARRRPGRAARHLGSRRARLATGTAALGCFLAAAALLGLDLSGTGPFAPPAPLPAATRVQIMLAEAAVLGSKGDVTQALATYDRVLSLRPRQPEALAEGGWLARLAGLAQHEPALVRNGDAEVEAAVQLDPTSAAARAYDGVLLLEDRHEPRRSVMQFRAMLADRPPRALLSEVRPAALAAFSRCHLRVPRAIARSDGS